MIVDFRKNVASINKWCCPLYAHHEVEVETAGYKKKFQFQKMDKICPTRNANITDVTKKCEYEEQMEKLAAEKKKKLEKEKRKQGKNKKENGTKSGETEEEDKKNKGPPPYMRRICNGEIFFIEKVLMLDDICIVK